MDALHEIEVLIRAKYPIVYIVSWEERRVEDALQQVSKKLERTVHSWSVTQGMRPAVNRATGPAKPTTLPGELEALALAMEAPEYTVFLLKDFHAYMKDSRVVRLLRDLANRLRGRTQTLFILAPVLNLPVELEKDVSVMEFPFPEPADIEKQINQVVDAVKDNKSLDVKLDSA